MRFLPILTTILAISHGCISSKDDDSDERRVLELRWGNSDIFTDKNFVETYLKTFGYLKDVPENAEISEVEQLKNQKEKLEVALKNFQEFMGITSSGQIDSATETLITKKRCYNKDQLNPSDPTQIWKKTILTYNILKYPTNMKKTDFEGMLQQAFSAWEIVISVDFVMVKNANEADILFNFEDSTDYWKTDLTHLSVGGFESEKKAKIWISDSENWNSNDEKPEIKTDLFNILVHEIGHALGLKHSQDSESVMYPIFERNSNERPRVTSNDVEKLRNLYDVENTESTSTSGITEETGENCPKTVESVTQASNGDLLLFKEDRIWQAVNNSIITSSTEIFQIFPGGPSYVNASATIGQSIILISDREIYAFIRNEGEAFVLAPEYPKILHPRVLFYPETAFPLANGSIILISDNIFATYDLDQNAPTMVNDKTVYFPNLPNDLRGGIPSSENVYLMFTSDSVDVYDFRIQQIVDSKPLTKYLICDL